MISDSDESPKSIAEKKLTGYPRGPLLGIPGAPLALPGPRATDTSQWTVCDTVSGDDVLTTVVAGEPVLGDRVREAAPSDASLVTAGDGTYLIFEGKRARVDIGQCSGAACPGHRRGAGADREPRACSMRSLRSNPLSVPAISRCRGRRRRWAGRHPSGSVIKVTGLSGGTTYYVALATGVQQVGEVAAEVIRQADTDGGGSVATMGPVP